MSVKIGDLVQWTGSSVVRGKVIEVREAEACVRWHETDETQWMDLGCLKVVCPICFKSDCSCIVETIDWITKLALEIRNISNVKEIEKLIRDAVESQSIVKRIQEQVNYSISLQQAIESHCSGKLVEMDSQHSKMLNQRLREQIIISVKGGVATVESQPKGTTIVVKDYDTEVYLSDELATEQVEVKFKRSEYTK